MEELRNAWDGRGHCGCIARRGLSQWGIAGCSLGLPNLQFPVELGAGRVALIRPGRIWIGWCGAFRPRGRFRRP
jgi:hypothetical protein